MKYKSKFKRIKAQVGIGDILGPQPELLPNAQPNYNWMTFPGEVPVNTNIGDPGFKVDNSGDTVDQGRIVPLQRDANGNVFTVDTKAFKTGTGRFKENPYIEAFNIAASEVTGIANMIQNNRLKKQERRQILHSLEPRYWQNMEAEGLNNIPMYTQYGGFGPNIDEPGFAHPAFYGDNTVYKYGGMLKYAAGGLTSKKAKTILKEGMANGQPLTDKQKRYFGWVAGGRKQAGGIADLLWQSGIDGSYANRKKLFNDYFAGNYSGTAEQNIKLFKDITSGKLTVPGVGKARVIPAAKKVSNIGLKVGEAVPDKPALESGVVVDKRKNQGYVVKNGKVQKQFPVITGKNQDINSNPYSVEYLDKHPELRNTPMGAYFMNPRTDIYGAPGYDMNPLFFDGNTPTAANLAMHITYDPAYRNQFYGTEQANKSYGCINCRKPDLAYVIQQFPKGDTLMVIDSKKGQSLNNMGIRQTGGGCDECNKKNMKKIKQTGGLINIYGLPDELEHFADVEAEAGEVIERQNGGIVKVADDGNTHEQGGEMIPGVRRVLEDTADKRKDPASKMLKVKPEVIQEVFGFKPKTAVTHAKAYELITAELKKTHKLYSDSRKNANMKPQMDKTAMNTLRLNEMFQGQLPTEQEVFELLFNHQEGVKAAAGINDDGSTMKHGGKVKAQAGANNDPIGTYSGGRTKQGRITPTGNVNAFNFPGGLEAFKKAWSPFVDLSKFKTVQEAQAATYDYLVKNQPEVAASIWQSQGLTAKGRKLIASDPKFAAIANQVFDKTGKLKEGVNLTPEQLSALTPAYADNMLGIRAVTPSVASKTTTEETPVEEQPPVKKQITPLNSGVTFNPKFVNQPNNEFYEPTYWSDIAAPFAGLVDSFRRWPELYNPMEFNQLRYKMLDPTAALTANQADFNAAVATTNEFGNSGAANANKATLLGQKYRANNQVMSQYDNQNAQIKNNEITYNTQVRDKQSVADAQSREKFYTNVLLGREAQRQQFLTSLGQLARVDQLKRRQNTSGNLLLKLSPAFDQFGEYNGYQYLPYLDPSMVNYNEDQVQPTKVSSKKTKTQNVTTWKDASGRVHKTTTTE